MKSVLLASALICSSAIAKDCDIDFNGDLQLEQQQITLTTSDNKMVVINPQHEVFINGEAIYLDSVQQQLVSDYYQHIYAIAPAATDIAFNAIDIANEGIGMAFTELLGSGSDVAVEFDMAMNDLRELMNHKFYAEDGSIRFNSASFKDGDVMGDEFEQQLQGTIEQAVKKSMGSLMMAIGQQMMFDGGNMNAFEERMKNFGQSIEYRIENSVAQIEQKAEALCYDLTKMDDTEDKIQASISELSGLNIISVSNHKHSI